MRNDALIMYVEILYLFMIQFYVTFKLSVSFFVQLTEHKHGKERIKEHAV